MMYPSSVRISLSCVWIKERCRRPSLSRHRKRRKYIILIKKISPHDGGVIRQIGPHDVLVGLWPDGILSLFLWLLQEYIGGLVSDVPMEQGV